MGDAGERGRRGEDLAAAYLESKGYTVLERNYFFQRAEVDLVAYEGTCIVFAEVKFRSGTAFGHPDESIGARKIANVRRAAEAWLYERKMEEGMKRLRKGLEALS